MGPTSTGGRSPALRLAACVAAGILLHRPLSLPPAFVWPAAGVLTVVLAVLLRRPARLSGRLLSGGSALLLVLLGLGRAADGASDGFLFPDSLLFRQTTMTGVITQEPGETPGRCRFSVKHAAVHDGGRATELPGEVLVTCREGTGGAALRYGMRVRVAGKLERPSPPRNPGEFDARSFYEANGIRLLLRAGPPSAVAVLNDEGGDWWMRRIVLPVRRALLRQIDASVGGEEGEFLKGILIGERGGLSRPLRDAFVRSGTAHILAVSGSNVAVVAAMIFLALGLLRISRPWKAGATCLGILFYVLLTGGQPPVVRAGIMAAAFLLASLAEERPPALNLLGLAAAAILLVEPRQIRDVGFQLSFAAVLAITLLYPPLHALLGRLPPRGAGGRVLLRCLDIAALSLAATLGTFPLTALWFGSVSIIGLLANIVVVPAAGASVVLGGVSAVAALVSEPVAGAYAALNGLLLRFVIDTVELAGGLPIAVLATPGFRWIDAVSSIAPLFLLLRLLRRGRLFAPVVLSLAGTAAALWSPASLPPPDGALRFSFLDVGQGDATVCELPSGRAMLIDAGAWSPQYDAGERVVVPYLRRRGIGELDLVVATHPHHDHIGGIAAVLRSLPVRGAIEPGQPVASPVYASFIAVAAQRAVRREAVRSGSVVSVDPAVRIYVLWPRPAFVTGDSAVPPDLNNTSVVLRICYGSVSFLLVGDAGVEAEAAMVAMYGKFLRSTVLKVGHHGSTGSSSERFLDAVSPRVAVLSVGSGNTFGHPSPEVLGRLRRRGVEVLRTDGEGAVILETDGERLRRVAWR